MSGCWLISIWSSSLLGFVQVVWRGYVQSMLQAGFTSDLVLYAASGLLTYGANDGMGACLLQHCSSCTHVSIATCCIDSSVRLGKSLASRHAWEQQQWQQHQHVFVRCRCMSCAGV